MGKKKTPYNKEQYDLLKRCSNKKDITEWNEWRKAHPDENIYLQSQEFRGCWLKEVNFLQGPKYDSQSKTNINYTGEVHLEEVDFVGANIENAKLQDAHLENANLTDANLENAYLPHAHLENANLTNTNLENANLWQANLRGAHFWNAKLQSAEFSEAIVDGETLFAESCEVDHYTTFEAVALGNLRMYSSMRQLLECNTRRMNWELWCRENPRMKWLVKPFWWVSNYGLSTWRIILTFFMLSVTFAIVYFVWGAVDYYCFGIKEQPGIVNNLFVSIDAKETVSTFYYSRMVFFRSLYFSIVTMTTLGFGDMYANATQPGYRWWFGHLLLMVQVILGYVLLGAMITRFAVLFTAGGPAGTFSKKETPKPRTEDKKQKE